MINECSSLSRIESQFWLTRRIIDEKVKSNHEINYG